jgi:hypothetical protein
MSRQYNKVEKKRRRQRRMRREKAALNEQLAKKGRKKV